MKYMMLIYGDEKALSQDVREACYMESSKYADGLRERGQFISAAPLQSVNTAASVRLRDGKAMVTDGPFAETHEQLGGYFMVEAKDMDEAIKIAEGIPGIRFGTVEVRPVVEMEGLPKLENF